MPAMRDLDYTLKKNPEKLSTKRREVEAKELKDLARVASSYETPDGPVGAIQFSSSKKADNATEPTGDFWLYDEKKGAWC